MSCIITVLTILSVFNGNQWNDTEVLTRSRIVYNMNEQISSKVEVISEDTIKTETVTVKCGEDIYSATTSILTSKE